MLLLQDRTQAEVDESLSSAKLSAEEIIRPLSQCVFFDAENNEDFFLIEADKFILDELSDELVIRGDLEDELVLCTGSRTYSVREAGISNSLAVVPDLLFPPAPEEDSTRPNELKTRRILRTFHTYWEPKQSTCSPWGLYRLLEPTELRDGDTSHEEPMKDPLTLDALLNNVQSSKTELEVALKKLPVVLFEGSYRMLSFEYHFRVLEFILTSIESNSMSFESIDTRLVIEEMTELEPEAIVTEVLSWYVSDGRLLTEKVSRTHAEALLRNGKVFDFEDFLETWRKSLPAGIDIDRDSLNGLSFIDRDGGTKARLHYLPFWEIPQAENARFDYLLGKKSAWTLEEIKPYIEDLTPSGVNVLLLKYARSFKRDGVSHYSKK